MSSKVNNIAAVSVVIPCYQNSTTILRAFNSILEQTLQPYEVIFVDDGSTDGTPNLLRYIADQYPNLVRVVLLPNNVGAASARNVGWNSATQNYIAFLDADDSWHPDKIRLQYDFMENHPEVSVCAHLCDYFGSNSQTRFSGHPLKVVSISPIKLIFKNYFSTPTVMIRKELPLRFEEGRRYAEDLQLWQSIAFEGYKIVRIECPLAYLHKAAYGEAGLSSNNWEMERGELKNIIQQYKLGHIKGPTLLVAIAFSLLKFSKRIIRIHLMGLIRKMAN